MRKVCVKKGRRKRRVWRMYERGVRGLRIRVERFCKRVKG